MSDCIEFGGHRNRQGYGKVPDGRLAHRVAWKEAFGAIPDGLCVLHICDNPACLNTDHLFLGTRADNAADMRSKGRSRDASGVNSNSAKLNEMQVQQIRLLMRRGEMLDREIAEAFGVDSTTVSNIKTSKTWASLPEELPL